MIPVRYMAEYAALRTAFFIVDIFPRAWLEGLFQGAADLSYIMLRARRKIAQDNIRRAGITTDPNEIDRIARASYRHLGLVLAETFELNQRNCADVWENQVELDAPPEALELLRDEKAGVVIASGHIGNWEMGALVTSHLKPLFAIARHMNNPHTNRLISQRRMRQRIHFTPKHDPDRRRFFRALDRGEGVVVMIDQHDASRYATMIDFFGVPAATHTSAARFHIHTGAPIVFVYCLRTAPHRYRLTVRGPIVHTSTGSKKRDARAILRQITGLLEDAIRECPEQYLWAHHRWKKKS